MHPKLLVQSLQGTRAQILFAFLFAGQAMDVEELMTWTGKDRKTHYVHLNALCGTGLLARQKLAHGRDLYLLGSEMLPALQAWVAQIGPGNAPLVDGAAPAKGNGQMSVLRTPAIDGGAVNAIQYESYEASFEKNMAACRKVGIGPPNNEKISKQPHVNPRFIIDHVESLGPGETIGLAILRILGDEVPRIWLDQVKNIPMPADSEVIIDEESE